MSRPLARALGGAVALASAASATAAMTLFREAIARRPPARDGAGEGADVVSATMAAARRDGRAWIAATAHERWQVTAHDGIRLAGYYFPAPRATRRTAVLIHGHRADAALMSGFANGYREHGFNVLLADNRAHGASEGRYVGMGWLDHLDYLRWIGRLVEVVGPGAEIVVHGLSMGGATALLLSGSPRLPAQVRAVISDCSFTSASAEFAYQLRRRHLPVLPALPLASAMCRLRAGYWFTQANPLDAITHAIVPVLLVHGGADTYNPTSMAHQLHAAHPGADLWIVPGAEHGMAYFSDPAQYRARVEGFLGRQCLA